jgi:diacylglycerol kinase family enzyme
MAERTTERNEKDIVLVCNPGAGGRWHQLADILDSEDAKNARRIVTDEIEDITASLRALGGAAKMVCIYGGDGTILKFLNSIFPLQNHEPPLMAFIGGGTMNVSARWCGWTEKPGVNFSRVIRQYMEDRLIVRDVPLLEVTQGESRQYGFTFGLGPAVRILNEYEHAPKGKAAAAMWAVRTIVAAYLHTPTDLHLLTELMPAEILIDGEVLPYDRWAYLFANTTGQIVRLVHPFPNERRRDTFYTLAYAVSREEGILMAPFLMRGKIPIDPKSLLKPTSDWKRIALAQLGKGSLPLDPRYVNRLAKTFEIRTREPIYQIDGDVFKSTGEPLLVKLGPVVRLVIGPNAPHQRAL